MSKPVSKVWTFASSSGRGSYETLQFTDGTTSCGCPGWTRRVDAQGNRSCKHTRSVDMGRADAEATSMHDYGTVAVAGGTIAARAIPAKSLRKDEAKRAGVTFGMSARKLA
ncbi:MAG: hypothetical protein WCF18_01640 [Chthoniobacteraceae bacterium]